ncbi:hypothetical protein [Lentzea sp. HUAS12]|uniref:hypothetical protein n=1 Tax=Lentzea sp. HUAS12 TaxID=2951806 RepID=UPI00209FCB92|nr:hypothetical protein [Lentzea sp. HUAS12]USX51576.1 hypothetical protein ND450_40545 [Lentzea sp. HUAS12]
MSGRSSGVVAAVLAAFALGAMTTVPASAEPAGNPIVELKSVARDQCMTRGTVDPFEIELADCTGAAPQRWEKVGLPNGQFFLRNVADRWCAAGEWLVTKVCDEADRLQRWELVTDGSGATKLKLDTVGYTYVDTSWYGEYFFKLITQEPQDGDHQRWVVTEVGRTTPLPDTTGASITLENSRWWAVEKTDNCAVGAGMGVCPGSPFQRVELGGGLVQLRAGEHCLRPKPGTTAVEFVDLAGDCAAADPGQQWQVEGPDVFGGHLLRNVATGKYLTPGTSLCLYEKGAFSGGHQLQRWYLHRV